MQQIMHPQESLDPNGQKIAEWTQQDDGLESLLLELQSPRQMSDDEFHELVRRYNKRTGHSTPSGMYDAAHVSLPGGREVTIKRDESGTLSVESHSSLGGHSAAPAAPRVPDRPAVPENRAVAIDGKYRGLETGSFDLGRILQATPDAGFNEVYFTTD